MSNDPLLHQMHYLQILELHHCLKTTKRLSNHLNLEFESQPGAATRSFVLLPNLFFIELFSIRVLHVTSLLNFQKRQLAFPPHVIEKIFQQSLLLTGVLVNDAE